MFVLSGSFDVYINGEKMHVRENQAIYSKFGALRAADNPAPNTIIAAFDFFADNDLPAPILNDLPNLHDLDDKFMEFNDAWVSDIPGSDVKCMGLFYLILHHLMYSKYSTSSNNHIHKIKQYISTNYSHPISISDISGNIGLNPIYCGALFKQKEGLSIAEYINKLRINIACAYLREGDVSVGEISYRVGYRDVYYFSKMFKKIIGMPPSEYKRRHINTVLIIEKENK